MPEPLRIGLAFRIAPELQEQIRAVDPRIELIDVSALGGRGPIDDAARSDLRTRLRDVEVLLGQNSLPTEYFDAAENLRWFQAINAGVDNMHARGLLDRGFAVTSAAGLAAVAIAEYSMGVMIMLARSLHTVVQQQQERRWEFRFSGTLAGSTLGIIGLGEIGRETARRARAFGMRVVATRRNPTPGAVDPDCDELFPHDRLPDVLSHSDYVLLAVPLTPETRHLLGQTEFARMKPTAYLVNVARGEVVDQSALIEALEQKTIAGAALDVVHPEPLPPDNPLWSMPNVILTPHTAGSVEGYGHRAVEIFIANLKRYVTGAPLRHQVDPVLGY